MLKTKLWMAVLFLVSVHVSSVEAQYSVESVGDPSGGWYHSEWCTTYHSGADSLVTGLVGVGNWDSPYEFWFAAASCESGPTTSFRGTHISVSPDYLDCAPGEYVSGLDGYFFTGPSRISALSGSCYSPSADTEHYLDGWLGQQWTANYRATWCNWGGVATGVYGTQETTSVQSTLQRMGLICVDL